MGVLNQEDIPGVSIEEIKDAQKNKKIEPLEKMISELLKIEGQISCVGLHRKAKRHCLLV